MARLCIYVCVVRRQVVWLGGGVLESTKRCQAVLRCRNYSSQMRTKPGLSGTTWPCQGVDGGPARVWVGGLCMRGRVTSDKRATEHKGRVVELSDDGEGSEFHCLALAALLGMTTSRALLRV